MASVSSSAMELAPDFSSLYRQYFGFAWASLRRLGVSTATIDDAAQDLWVTVHRRLESLDSRASAKAWLFGIARRVASHYRRTEQRHRRKLDAYSMADVHGLHEPMKRGEAALTMEVFLSKLDETKRVAFVLSEVEGWSAPEIARVVGTNANTVYSRVRLARQQLRKHLQDSESELSPAACVDAVRRSTQPPPDAAKRCWAALAPKLLSTAATATGTGVLAKLKLVGVGALLGGLGVAGLGSALPETTPAPTSIATPALAAAGPRDEPTAAPAPRPPATEHATPPTADAAETSAVHPAATPRPRPNSPATVAPTTDADSLRAETRLLTRAKRELERGHPLATLETVRTHRTRYPDSALADLRNVLEVQATCSRGQHEHARSLAAYHARSASEAAAAKLRAACPD